MKITLFSNFLNHHQYPLCNEFLKLPDTDFHFVATETIPDERVSLGYSDMNKEAFVIREYESDAQKKTAEKLCAESDVVIFGSAPESYAKLRIGTNKLLLRYSERIFKKGLIHSFSPRAIKIIGQTHTVYRDKNVYLLGASAYAASDYNRMGAYPNKVYKWGYFPDVRIYDSSEEIIRNKKPGTILWAARFIDWKRPFLALDVAKKLKEDGYEFQLNMVGNGELSEAVVDRIRKDKLESCVRLLGSKSPQEVRKQMEESEIFLFTSDFYEGWGAVLNESMNSCCAVVASHAIGSVPYMIEHKKNGLIFRNESFDSLYSNVCSLLDDSSLRSSVQRSAYDTVVTQWNPEVAAKRLVLLSDDLMLNGSSERFSSGPCSRAQKLSNRWFR